VFRASSKPEPLVKWPEIPKHSWCSERDLLAFEKGKRARETLIYYSGPSLGGSLNHNDRSLVAIVNRVRKLYNAGLCDLTQRRVSWGDSSSMFDYIIAYRAKQAIIDRTWALDLIK
jgi:hypothetical protein